MARSKTWWNKPEVQALPDAEHLLIADYLCNDNVYSNQVGIYQITPYTIAGQFRFISEERIIKIISKLVEVGLVLYEHNYVGIIDYHHENTVLNNPKYQSHIRKILDQLPPKIKDKYTKTMGIALPLGLKPIANRSQSIEADCQSQSILNPIQPNITQSNTNITQSNHPLPPQPSISEPEPSAPVQSQAGGGAGGLKSMPWADTFDLTPAEYQKLLDVCEGDRKIALDAINATDEKIKGGETVNSVIRYAIAAAKGMMERKGGKRG